MVDLEARFRLMDRFPGYRQLPSLVSPPVETLADSETSLELARTANDELAELAAEVPDRFPGFVASLPLNNVEASLQEAERAVRELGALGVQVFTSVLGKPLDLPEYLQIIELAAKLDCAVWLHPTRTMERADYPTEEFSRFEIWWSLGWPYETSVAMLRLVFAGVFDRYPNLKIIAHHAGGMIPMMEGRIWPGLENLGSRTPPDKSEAVKTDLRENPLSAVKRFYADTATFGSRAAIECGLSFFGADRMLFASDMPFGQEGGAGHIRSTLEAIDKMDLSEPEKRAILSGNAERLFKLSESLKAEH
jgi:aminocarboxymuconate-semialdehyde decarboxylase